MPRAPMKGTAGEVGDTMRDYKKRDQAAGGARARCGLRKVGCWTGSIAGSASTVAAPHDANTSKLCGGAASA